MGLLEWLFVSPLKLARVRPSSIAGNPCLRLLQLSSSEYSLAHAGIEVVERRHYGDRSWVVVRPGVDVVPL